jgi:hypothetical protein
MNGAAELAVLAGIWDSYSDGYIISTTSLEYHFESRGMDFSGDIKHIAPYGEDRGVIIIEYTRPPETPYATGNISHVGIYYRIIGPDAIKFANSYDVSGTDTLDLAAALTKFSGENESSFVFDWDSTYILFRQPAPVCDMGALKGTWEGDDDYPTWLTISDYRLTVCMVGVSPLTVVYSGTIARTSDPGADTGAIVIQFTTGDNAILTNIKNGRYYTIHWRKTGDTVFFSVYNDSDTAFTETPDPDGNASDGVVASNGGDTDVAFVRR